MSDEKTVTVHSFEEADDFVRKSWDQMQKDTALFRSHFEQMWGVGPEQPANAFVVATMISRALRGKGKKDD